MSAIAFGQKFVIQENDTLLYKLKRIPTGYEGSCNTFEIVNGQIINREVECLRQGLWIITDSLGNYWTGNYHNNHEEGIWKRLDKSGKLLKETEEASFGKDTYKVKEIDYSSGKPVTVVDRNFLAFYIKNLIAIMIIFFGTFFGRVFINSRIYNIENGTNFSTVYFFIGPFVTKDFGHSLLSTFTFWFSNYKPENRPLVIISNTMSAIALSIFFGIIIGLAVNGELH